MTDVNERTTDAWTAVHAPRVAYANDHPPDSSWWAETPTDQFYQRARAEYAARMIKSNRQTGQRGIDG